MSNAESSTHRQTMLEEWQTGARILANGHYDASKRDSLWNDILGATVIAATVAVGSTIFASLGSSTERGWQIAAGIISMSATLLASEQKYLRLEERATQHREAGRVYQALRQEIEVALTRLQDGVAVSDDEIAAIKSRRDDIEKTAPTVPSGIYKRVLQEIMKSKNNPDKGAVGSMAT